MPNPNAPTNPALIIHTERGGGDHWPATTIRLPHPEILPHPDYLAAAALAAAPLGEFSFAVKPQLFWDFFCGVTLELDSAHFGPNAHETTFCFRVMSDST